MEDKNKDKKDYSLVFSKKQKVSREFKDLVRKMLDVTPGKRLTAEQVLAHPWFNTTPTFVEIMNEKERQLIRIDFSKKNISKILPMLPPSPSNHKSPQM